MLLLNRHQPPSAMLSTEHPVTTNQPTEPTMKRFTVARFRRWLQEEDGFSMTELMVVMVIIGILALLALPRFMNVTSQAKMAEAKMALRQVHALQSAYFYEHARYAESVEQLGYEPAPTISEGGTARYQIAVSASGNTYSATATAVEDFDADGTMNVWTVDQTGSVQQTTAD